MPELSLDLLLQQGLSVQQIENSIRNGEFTISDEDFTRLGRLSLDAQSSTQPQLGEGLVPGSEEANAAIDASAAQLRTTIFESGKPTEEIVALQNQLRSETRLLKGEVEEDPGLGNRIFAALSSGTDIGDTGFKVNIPLLAAGLTLATGGIAAGGGLGAAAILTGARLPLVGSAITAGGVRVGGTIANIPGVASAASQLGGAISKVPFVSKVPQVVRAHPKITGTATGVGTLGTGLVLADQDSPDVIAPPIPTGGADVATSLAAIQDLVPSGEPTGPIEGGTGIPEIDQFLPRFEEVETPFGRAVVTMQPQIIGGRIVGFEPVDVRFPDRDAQREERETAEFEASQQQGQITAIQQQLQIANFLADPGNRLRLQATQALTAGVPLGAAAGTEAGEAPGSVLGSIPGRQSGQLGALLGLDPSANVPLGQLADQPFGATPSFSALQDLDPNQLSELNALAQIGFGSDLATLERSSKAKRLPGGGRRPIATFGR
ncbi:hypothetical protein LCGC14_1987440 [marine sediment metagenome]|uniref:Uncharacterized protein n=1 Tax=marine sediment metagenome TaxID=412755 RepID=A0A0F9FV37_9ZZZZ